MKLRTLLASGSLVLLLALPVSSGCTTVAGLLPDVLSAITDGGHILDTIASFVASWFVTHPDAEAQKKVDEAITKARIALNVALRTAQGTKNLDDASIDAAFDDFKAAYLELMALVKPYGVRQSQIPDAKHMKAEPGVLIVPQPLAFKKGAHQ